MNKTKLVPFDIEKAKHGAKVVTRYGYPAEVKFHNAKVYPPIMCLVEMEGKKKPYAYTLDGRIQYTESSEDNDLDLFIEEEEIENQDEQKLSDKFEIIPDKWYVCTCQYTCEDFLFLLNFPYLGKDILKCHLPEDKNYQDFLRPWTDQDANSNEFASIVSYIDKNKNKNGTSN